MRGWRGRWIGASVGPYWLPLWTSLGSLLLFSPALANLDPVATPDASRAELDALLRSCPIGEVRIDAFGAAFREEVRAPRKEQWEKAHGGKAGLVRALKQRLVGWPQRRPGEIALPSEARAFAWQLARDTWRGLYALRDREHALPIDHVRWSGPLFDVEGAKIGDYASSTNIGLFLAAVVAARELRFIDSAEATQLVRQVLDTLDRLETRRGFLFNYYDTTSLERTSNLLSFVDSSWFTAGLIVVRNALPELKARTTRWIEAANYNFFYDRSRRQMHHGFYVHTNTYSPFHYGMWFTEARLGSLIAIGKGDVPREHWFATVRTYPPGCTWQRQSPRAPRVERRNGLPLYLGYYEWEGLSYVPSWGGSMFEALMPLLFLDEVTHAPQGLGANARAHVRIQQLYSQAVLHDAVWGQSPCLDPASDEYREYGVPVLGTRGYAPGAVTPHAAALALLVDPAAALANLQELARRYPLYADYGLFDAVDPRSGRVATAYLFLDQAMTFLALANFLAPACVQRHFTADPIVQAALPLLKEDAPFQTDRSLDPRVADK